LSKWITSGLPTIRTESPYRWRGRNQAEVQETNDRIEEVRREWSRNRQEGTKEVKATTFWIMSALIPSLLGAAQEFHPDIPKAWDDKEVQSFELPLAQRDRSPKHISSEEYYKFKVRPIYRSYPAYAKGMEPAGYLESLKQKDPEIIFDASKLHTKEDWIQGGRLVFESDILFRPARAEQPLASEAGWPVSKEGVLPSFLAGYRYYVRKKGVLETGINACANCHTSMLPDGSFLEGGQGHPPPGSEARLRAIRELTPEAFHQQVNNAWKSVGVPWVMSKAEFEASLTREEMVRRAAAIQSSVFGRQGTGQGHPVHGASLIGVRDLQYLDATGLVRNRSIGDLMRYAIANQGLDTLAHYGDFQPGVTNFSGEEGTRYSDEQLYALALYIESLKPPPNPNTFDEKARRGQRVFQQQGCVGCHTPPLYTNNKLTPALGFKVPDDLRVSEAVLDVCVGTDPTLAMQTRRGTGFYKVPSLRGAWYRTSFGHGGWAETLEEWFNPGRLQDSYVPQGFHLGPGPIKGHEFGLKLSPDDKQALIAFLKTL
jgi:mono/diheme cytochrome c family protein